MHQEVSEDSWSESSEEGEESNVDHLPTSTVLFFGLWHIFFLKKRLILGAAAAAGCWRRAISHG